MPYLNREDASLFYISEGQGRPVLFLHGWACDSQDFIFQIPFFQSLGFQTIALDSRGYGRSSIPPKSEPQQLRPEVTSDDAVALLDHLRVTAPAIVVGHSLGCLTASLLAIRAPERVSGLVLISPMYYNPTAAYAAYIGKMSNGQAHDVLAATFATTVGPEWLKTWHRMRLLGTPEWVAYQTGLQNTLEPACGTWEIGRELWRARRSCPRLVVLRDEENLEKERSLGVGDKDRVEVMNAGHWMHVHEAEKFNQTLREWLVHRRYASQ